MGFIDNVKESVRSGAGMAATKAQEEYEKMQARRDVAQAYEDLGAKTFELADRGEVSHGELSPLLEQVRTAKARLDGIGKEQTGPASTTAAETPPEEPPPGT